MRLDAVVIALACLAALAGAGAGDRVPARSPEADLRAAPAVLLMVDERGCIYCARWDRDVAEGYLASAEGRFAPLVRRRIGHPDLAFLPGLRYTPTFIVLVEGREIGRIEGYRGADFFWGQIETLLRAAGFGSRARKS